MREKRMNKRFKFNGVVVLLLSALFVVISGCSGSKDGASAEENFPSKPITVIVPANAGGGYDTLMRPLSTVSQTHFGQALIIENRPGGNQAVGLELVKKAKPDGYTVGIGSHGSLGSSPVQADVPYDPLKDFKYVIQLIEPFQMLAVSADSPFNTVKDLVEYGKANPGKVTIGDSGTGGIHYFVARALADKAGIEIKNVPFDSSGASAIAVAGGHVMAHVGSSASTHSLVEAGKVKLLASVMNERDPAYPDVPTLVEAGYDVKVGNAWGLLVPKDTPDAIVQKLYEGFKASAEDEAFVALAQKLALEIKITDGPTFGKSVEEALEFYRSFK